MGTEEDHSSSGAISSTMDSWWSWFSKVQDDQRIERLQRCRELQDVLVNCQSQPRNSKSATTSVANKYNPTSIESFSGGLRTMKYFGWRGILQQEELPERVQTAIIKSCSREQHALWACRAVAVGCGKELGALKAGFDQLGEFGVLFEQRTAYEPSNHTEEQLAQIPCAHLQSALGTCVQTGANGLLERTQHRDKLLQSKG
jgi:hypothetical protein